MPLSNRLTQQERTAAMPVARRVRKTIALTVHLATVGVICWTFAYPYPVRVVIGLLVAIPWIAIGLVVLSNGAFLFSFDDDMLGRGRPGNVALLILVSCLALPLVERIARLGIPPWPLDLPSLLIPALFGGVLLAILVNTVSRMAMGVVLHRLHWITSCFCFSCYALGAIIAVNGLLDQAPPETFAVVITDGHAESLIGRHTRRVSLDSLSPFYKYDLNIYMYDFSVRSVMDGQYDGPNPISVPSSLFKSKQIGDTICVYSHPGALQKRWISVDNCNPARADHR